MLLRQSVLYFAANLAAAVIGFASVMLLTRLVAPAEYGIFVVATSIGAVLATTFFTWQRHAILRFQSEARADVRLSLLGGYLATLALHPLALLLLVTVLSIPLKKALAAVLIAAAISFFELGQEILRARQHVASYVRATLVRSATSLGLCLLAVVLDSGGIGLALAMVASYLVGAVSSAKDVWQAPREPARLDVVAALAAYGLPITLSGIFVAVSLALDRFVVFSLLGSEAVGLYGATIDFVRQCAIVPALSASLAVAPLAIAKLTADDPAATSRHLADGASLLLAVLMPAAVGLAVAAPEIAGTILGPAYRATAVDLMPVAAFAFLAHALSQQYVQLSFALARKPGLYIAHTGAILLINALLIVPLVRQWGLIGAAMSMLIAEASGVVLGCLMARRAFPLPRIVGPTVRIAAACLAMALSVLAVRHVVGRTDQIGLLAVVSVAAVVYATVAFLLDVAGWRREAHRALARRRTERFPLRASP